MKHLSRFDIEAIADKYVQAYMALPDVRNTQILKDLTQEQLAAQVGVRRETIMRLEKAQYNSSLKLAIDIARVVEAPIEEIFVFKRSVRN